MRKINKKKKKTNTRMKRRHATGLLLPTNAPELQIPLYKRAFNEYQPLHIPTDSDLHIDKPLGQGGNRADEKPSMVSSLPKEVFPLYLSRGLAGASAITARVGIVRYGQAAQTS